MCGRNSVKILNAFPTIRYAFDSKQEDSWTPSEYPVRVSSKAMYYYLGNIVQKKKNFKYLFN